MREGSGKAEDEERFTISVGIAEWTPDIYVAAVDLTARADEALYRAKEAGRNGYAISGMKNRRPPGQSHLKLVVS